MDQEAGFYQATREDLKLQNYCLATQTVQISATWCSYGETAPSVQYIQTVQTMKGRYLTYFTCILWDSILHLNKMQHHSIIQSLKKNPDLSNKKNKPQTIQTVQH